MPGENQVSEDRERQGLQHVDPKLQEQSDLLKEPKAPEQAHPPEGSKASEQEGLTEQGAPLEEPKAPEHTGPPEGSKVLEEQEDLTEQGASLEEPKALEHTGPPEGSKVLEEQEDPTEQGTSLEEPKAPEHTGPPEGSKQEDPTEQGASLEEPKAPEHTDSPEMGQRDEVLRRKLQYEEIEQQQDKRTEDKFRELSERQITLHQVEVERFREQRELFVRPPSFDNVLRELEYGSHRVVLVTGDSDSGKQTFAINLAVWILENKLKRVNRKVVWFYTERRSDQTLLNMIYDPNLQEHSVVIIEEVIQKGLLTKEMELGPVDLSEVLRSRDVYLVLTASVSAKDHHFLYSDQMLVGNTKAVDLEKVLRRHADYFYDQNLYPDKHSQLEELLTDSSIEKALLDQHNRPGKLGRFFRLLKNRPDLPDKEEFYAEIKAPHLQRERDWFAKLTPLNYRLYAMMVALFESLEVQSLDALYFEIVRYFREQEGLTGPEQFVDPRQIGLRDLRVRAALIESGPVLEFEDDNYRQIVLEEIEENYWLLWSMHSYLVDFIISLQQSDNPRYRTYDDRRRVRDIIAFTLAVIGIHNRPELRVLLAKLVKHQEAFVVVTASSILRVLAETGRHDDFVIEILDKWIKSKDFDKIWAACASIGRLYPVYSNWTNSEISRPSAHQTTYLLDELDKCLTFVSQNYRDQELDKESLSEYWITELVAQFGEPRPDEREAFRRKVSELVERQIQLRYDDIRLALVDTVREISVSNPPRAHFLLRSWLEPGSHIHHYEHARMALNYIWNERFKTNAAFLEKRAFPKLFFLEPTIKASRGLTAGTIFYFLSLAVNWDTMHSDERGRYGLVIEFLEQEPIISAAKAMLQWHETATSSLTDQKITNKEDGIAESRARFETGEGLWERQVRPQLMSLSTRITRSERLLLIAVLMQEWGKVDHTKSAVLRVLHLLVTRSHVLNGEIVLVPTTKLRGLVVVDDDASVKDDEYLVPILKFVRTLAGLLPVDVYSLGNSSQRYRIGERITRPDSHGTTVSLRNLRTIGQQRPPLLMPIILKPSHFYTPEDCAFLVVFNTRAIIDIHDLFSLEDQDMDEQSGSTTTSLLKQRVLNQQQNVGKEAQKWNWANRIFLSDSSGVPGFYQPYVHRINEPFFGLRQQLISLVAKLQIRIPVDILEDQVRMYSKELPRSNGFKATVSDWLELTRKNESQIFDNVDVVLAIVYAFLLEIQVGKIENTHDILAEWLQDKVEDTVTRAIGVATTRILFSVILSNPQASLEQVNTLVQLLPKFSKAITDYSELLPIIEQIIEWGHTKKRAEYLVQTEELKQSFHIIETDDLQKLTNWFIRYDYLLTFVDAYVLVEQPVESFRDMLNEIKEQIEDNRGQNNPKTLKIANYLPPEELKNLLQIFRAGFADGNINEVYHWLLLKIVHLQSTVLLDEDMDVQAYAKQMNATAARIKQIAQHRLYGTVQQLEPDRYYGVIIIDAASQNALQIGKRLLPVFFQHCPDNLLLVVHHLGNPAIIQQIDKSIKDADEQKVEPNNIRPAVLGPVLTRYAMHQEQIAFVLVITEAEVLDYDDWLEMRGAIWAYRTCTMVVGSDWMPVRGELVELSDDTSIVNLANRLFERIEQ
jgi:KaiC/GvpD/RAD55 family RecA-like ATPase